jgi:hypothetical protein
MTWARLDDGFWMHPKVLMAGNTAAGIFARFLSYCGCYLTDGLIPEAIADSIIGKDKKAFDALEAQGFVQRLETGSVYIPGYSEHNPSKAEIEETRRERAKAGRKGGLAKARANGKQGLRSVG